MEASDVEPVLSSDSVSENNSCVYSFDSGERMRCCEIEEILSSDWSSTPVTPTRSPIRNGNGTTVSSPSVSVSFDGDDDSIIYSFDTADRPTCCEIEEIRSPGWDSTISTPPRASMEVTTNRNVTTPSSSSSSTLSSSTLTRKSLKHLIATFSRKSRKHSHATRPSERFKHSLANLCSIYSTEEISSVTNNSLSSFPKRCTLRGKDTVVFRHTFRGDPTRVPDQLSSICWSRHRSLVRLLGASVTAGDSIFLVYEHVDGVALDRCLRNPYAAPLSSWNSRMQVAVDVAQGLEYIHHYSGVTDPRHRIHNRIRSSNVIITRPDLGAKICHLGAANLVGDEYEAGEGDVFDFGLLLLELFGGEGSLVDTAREVMGSPEEERKGRLRLWVDQRLGNSFSLEVAEMVVAVALKCVEPEAVSRPNMVRVAGMLCKLRDKSRMWADQIKVLNDFGYSLNPR